MKIFSCQLEVQTLTFLNAVLDRRYWTTFMSEQTIKQNITFNWKKLFDYNKPITNEKQFRF